MEIILKEDIIGLGYKNDIVNVKSGYGRNYLIPTGKAVIASPSAKKVLAENLKQQAHKLERLKAEAEKKQRIQHVLETFGLERERSSLVSKLSGGQRKRLSIAVEYIGDPKLFFLDEPDSGLDGIMARSLMEDLRIIADENRIVLVITHQPDRVSDLFDKVIVLAKGVKDNIGHLAFFGIVEEAYDFFETDSLEGIVRRINRPDEGGEGLADHFIEKFSLVKENQDG